MKKFVVICILFTAVCLFFQKQGQTYLKSMSSPVRDTDPNSRLRKMVAEQRATEAKEAEVMQQHQNRLNADLMRRLKAAGELPLDVPAQQVAIYLFNESGNRVTVSIVTGDNSKLAPDRAVEAGGFTKAMIDRGRIAYVTVIGKGARWAIDLRPNREVVADTYGCVFR